MSESLFDGGNLDLAVAVLLEEIGHSMVKYFFQIEYFRNAQK
ncbi:hypothetical protein [Dapis sp. BLCC M229]